MLIFQLCAAADEQLTSWLPSWSHWIGVLLEILGQPCEQSVHCSLLTESLGYDSKHCFLPSWKHTTPVFLFHWEKLPFLKSKIDMKGKKEKSQWGWGMDLFCPFSNLRSWSFLIIILCADSHFSNIILSTICKVNIHSLKCIQGY